MPSSLKKWMVEIAVVGVALGAVIGVFRGKISMVLVLPLWVLSILTLSSLSRIDSHACTGNAAAVGLAALVTSVLVPSCMLPWLALQPTPASDI